MLCLSFLASLLRFGAFFVEAGGEFGGVAFVVEFQEAVEDGAAGGFGDGVADALFGLVGVVAEDEVGPAVGGGDGVVHFDVQGAQGADVFC